MDEQSNTGEDGQICFQTHAQRLKKVINCKRGTLLLIVCWMKVMN